MKNTNAVFFVALALIFSVSLYAVPSVAAVNGNIASIDPPSTRIEVGSTFNLSIKIEATSDIAALDFNLTYNNETMKFITADVFPWNTSDFSWAWGNEDSGNFYIEIECGSSFNDTRVVVTIVFECIAPGDGYLHFKDALLFNNAGAGSTPGTFDGSVTQYVPPVGGEVLTVDALALLIPWVATTGAVAVAVATVLVFAGKRTFNR